MKIEKYKIVLFLLGIIVFMFLIILALLLPNGNNKSISKTSVTDKTNTMPVVTNTINESPIQTNTNEDLSKHDYKDVIEKRDDKTFKSDGSGKLKVIQMFRNSFKKYVNENKKINDSDFFMISKKNDLYKNIQTKINKFKRDKISIEIKSITIVDYIDKGKTSTLKTKETIGTKKDTDKDFNYKDDYNVEYTFTINNNGISITEIKGGI